MFSNTTQELDTKAVKVNFLKFREISSFFFFFAFFNHCDVVWNAKETTISRMIESAEKSFINLLEFIEDVMHYELFS
jgi:hypothetical protein